MSVDVPFGKRGADEPDYPATKRQRTEDKEGTSWSPSSGTDGGSSKGDSSDGNHQERGVGQERPRSDSKKSTKDSKTKKDKSSKKKKHKKKKKKSSKEKKSKRSPARELAGPVQLSTYLQKSDNESGAAYSVVSGKKIKMKLEKTKADRIADKNREQLLAFLNSAYD